MQQGNDPRAAASEEQHASDKNTRPQQGGEAQTTRFGMEDGDNTDVPATGVNKDQQSSP